MTRPIRPGDPISPPTKLGRGSEPANTKSEAVMSDEDDWDFADADDAKVTIRAAIRYLLKGTTDGVRGDIVQKIISIVLPGRERATARPTELLRQ